MASPTKRATLGITSVRPRLLQTKLVPSPTRAGASAAQMVTGTAGSPLPTEALQHYWGFSSFRRPQEEVIQAVLSGRDVLLVMATGSGKSITYQIPPLVSGGVAVVISPLISLMEDQVAALNARGITAAFLGSAQANNRIKEAAWRGEYSLVYMTPELATNSGPRMAELHRNKRIVLVAVDEAHCVSEWGHDFRPEYQQLGSLRRQLQGVPFMALTATATPGVQDEIVNNLAMMPSHNRFVMSFERPNLHLSVERREGGMEHSLRGLLQRKRQAVAAGRPAEATLIYCLTRTQVDEVAAFLGTPERFGNKVARYQGSMSINERSRSHHTFLQDDVEVMVATLAYGMGIDKANVRHIIHWGSPASLEAYYQQAGRAGRDGAPATCRLLYSGSDVSLLDTIKDAASLSSTGRTSYEKGLSKMQGFASSGGCRHKLLSAHFAAPLAESEAAAQQWTPCRGGCDNCDARKKNGSAAQAHDMSNWTAMLLEMVKGLGGAYGVGRPISILRGSNNKDITQRMKEMCDNKGEVLHGAGKTKSEDWWKALVGLLVGHGLLAYQTRQSGGGYGAQARSFSALTITQQGTQWLSSRPALVLDLPPAMQEEEARSRKQALERQRNQEAAEAQRQEVVGREEVALEHDALLNHLRATRKETADRLNMVRSSPDSLVTEATLRQIAALRPATLQQLAQVSGMSAAAMTQFGPALLGVVCERVAGSKYLKHAADWNKLQRSVKQAQEMQASVNARVVEPWLAEAARGLVAGQKDKLSEAAQRAAASFETGVSVAELVAANTRPVQPSTILSYLCDAAAAGMGVDLARLAVESKLDGPTALHIGDIVARLAALLPGTPLTLRAIKDQCEPHVEYGQIKTVAVLMAERVGVFSGHAAILMPHKQTTLAQQPAGSRVPEVASWQLQGSSGAVASTPGGGLVSQDEFLDGLDDDEVEAMLAQASARNTPQTQGGATTTPFRNSGSWGAGQPPSGGAQQQPAQTTDMGAGAGLRGSSGSSGGAWNTRRSRAAGGSSSGPVSAAPLEALQSGAGSGAAGPGLDALDQSAEPQRAVLAPVAQLAAPDRQAQPPAVAPAAPPTKRSAPLSLLSFTKRRHTGA